MKKKVIIDCDPGIDDSLALILALSSSEIDIVGITIVSGNVEAKQGAKNALKVLKLMKREDIKVYIGEELPLVRELITAQDTHGEDGLGETHYEEANIEINYGGVDFILENAKKGDLNIIALGPLTNLAKAIEKDIEAFNMINEIVSMGGAYKSHGNCSQVAEFNYWVDPHSVSEVFEKSNVPFSMVGLDVTRDIILTPNLIELIKQIGGEVAEFIGDITRFYVDFHWEQERTLGCVINDPLAVAYFIDRTLCEGFTSYLDIVTEGKAVGQTLVDVGEFYRKDHNGLVLTKVDAKKFMIMFLERILPNNKKDIELVLNNEKYGVN
ncbi:Pyrimidine-specific ribonucleoside hydrolase rihA [uncultured Clostridium sp.]|uniref:nucleoside hydrolase n=1 Tax=uncultured Clostridium sp. TaxID=59620 RepID=UPI0008216D67|nr:nucleoside hydrolase [uncultured Clostridium sp.]SCK01884.1 Pyrimidine-specific ribonucleoside hydrolase rihA [uncultured Clostridium sp.]